MESQPPLPLDQSEAAYSWWPNSRAERVFDVIGASAITPAAILVVGGVAIASFIETGENPFFVQNRIGKNGETFPMYKLRSLEGCDDYDTMSYGINDPRVTKVGAFIRPYGVDELAQVLNVLRGDMTLLGSHRADNNEHRKKVRLVLGENEYYQYVTITESARPAMVCYQAIETRLLSAAQRESKKVFAAAILRADEYLPQRSLKYDLKMALAVIPMMKEVIKNRLEQRPELNARRRTRRLRLL